MPESPVHFHKDRWRPLFLAVFYHRYAVPLQGSQNGQRSPANVRIRLYAHPHGTSRTGRMNIADAPVGKLSPQLAVMQEGEVSCAFALHELLNQHRRGTTADVKV